MGLFSILFGLGGFVERGDREKLACIPIPRLESLREEGLELLCFSIIDAWAWRFVSFCFLLRSTQYIP